MRAVSLSHPEVIELLNSSFVPVYTTNDDYSEKGSAPPKEKRLLAEVHRQGYEKKLSVGTVHGYVIAPTGELLDSLHTVDVAKPEKLLAMLRGTVAKLRTVAGKRLVQPVSTVVPPVEPGGVVLQLVTRWLDKRGTEYKLIVDAGGNWSAFPAEERFTLAAAQVRTLLPPAGAKAGARFEVPIATARRLVERFYPPTENWDLTTDTVEAAELNGELETATGRGLHVRLTGKVRIWHPFYHVPDENRVEATVVGYADFDAKRMLMRLTLVTNDGTYAGQPFGAVLRSW